MFFLSGVQRDDSQILFTNNENSDSENLKKQSNKTLE